MSLESGIQERQNLPSFKPPEQQKIRFMKGIFLLCSIVFKTRISLDQPNMIADPGAQKKI